MGKGKLKVLKQEKLNKAELCKKEVDAVLAKHGFVINTLIQIKGNNIEAYYEYLPAAK